MVFLQTGMKKSRNTQIEFAFLSHPFLRHTKRITQVKKASFLLKEKEFDFWSWVGCRREEGKDEDCQLLTNVTHHLYIAILQIKKAEMDRKTLDWEIVELTNKLLDAKTTINKLEELNVRFFQNIDLV